MSLGFNTKVNLENCTNATLDFEEPPTPMLEIETGHLSKEKLSIVPDNTATNLKVMVRVRPKLVHESEDTIEPFYIDNESNTITVNTPKKSLSKIASMAFSFKNTSFQLDQVFPPSTQQQELYNITVQPLISNFLSGSNVTLIAYGQTGSGKTYTMGTNLQPIQDDQLGLIPRTIENIFKDFPSQASLTISYIEIYNEIIFDLLNKQDLNPEYGYGMKPKLNLVQDNKGRMHCPTASRISVSHPSQVERLLSKGNERRRTGSTLMNADSSRSHVIFTLNLKVNDTLSKFHFIDLAGLEKSKSSESSEERKKEGISINGGLLALGNVINVLTSDHSSSDIPYRDSKLTQFLQDSLGGNTYTTMVACISPCIKDMSETINTLQYAARARNIKLISKKTVTSPQLVQSLQGTICELKQELGYLKKELFDVCEGKLPNKNKRGYMNSTSEMKANFSRKNDLKHLSLPDMVTRAMRDALRRSHRFETELLLLKQRHALLQQQYLHLKNKLSVTPLPNQSSIITSTNQSCRLVTFKPHKVQKTCISNGTQTDCSNLIFINSRSSSLNKGSSHPKKATAMNNLPSRQSTETINYQEIVDMKEHTKQINIGLSNETLTKTPSLSMVIQEISQLNNLVDELSSTSRYIPRKKTRPNLLLLPETNYYPSPPSQLKDLTSKLSSSFSPQNSPTYLRAPVSSPTHHHLSQEEIRRLPFQGREMNYQAHSPRPFDNITPTLHSPPPDVTLSSKFSLYSSSSLYTPREHRNSLDFSLPNPLPPRTSMQSPPSPHPTINTTPTLHPYRKLRHLLKL